MPTVNLRKDVPTVTLSKNGGTVSLRPILTDAPSLAQMLEAKSAAEAARTGAEAAQAVAEEAATHASGGQQITQTAAGAYPARTNLTPAQFVGATRPPVTNGDTWIAKKDGLLTEIASLPGLVGYWPMNEGAGTTAADKTSSPVNGTVSGTGAVLGGWNQPAGVGALGLRPGGSGRVDVASAAKFNTGDNFSALCLFRRRNLVAGTVVQHGLSLYATTGTEKAGNPDFESAFSTTSFVGNWRASGLSSGLALDTAVKFTGSSSARLDIDSANTNNGMLQIFPSEQPGRKRLRIRAKDDPANVNGKHSLQVSYVPAAGGSTKYLQANGTWTTSVVNLDYGHDHSGFVLHELIFDLPEATGSSTNGLAVTGKRQGGAGGGSAYSIWFDRDGTNPVLCDLAPTSGAWAVTTDAAGVFALKVPVAGSGYVTVASSPASTDHLGFHALAVGKAGASTKVLLDGADVTVAGTNVTVGAGALPLVWGNGDFGQFEGVLSQGAVRNQTTTQAEAAAIYAEGDFLCNSKPTSLRVGTNNFTMRAGMDGNRATYAQKLRDMGVTTSREALFWLGTETSEGIFDWTRMDDTIDNLTAQGIEILPFFDLAPDWAVPTPGQNRQVPTDVTLTKGLSVASAGTSFSTWVTRWTNFATACVNRYKDRIHSWEILNEMNAEIFSYPAASAPLYVYLYNSMRTAILAADPTAKVGIAGLARMKSEAGTTSAAAYLADEWVRALIDGGINNFDFVGCHPYPDSNGSIATHYLNGTSGDRVHRIHDTLVEYGRTTVDVQLNEVGWYTGITTVAASSGGTSLSGSTLNVVDASRLPSSGTIYTLNSAGTIKAIAYTGKTGNQLTGCTGGTGTAVTGYPISIGLYPITELTQGQRIAEAVTVARNHFSAFCSFVGFFSANTINSGTTTDALEACRLYDDYALTLPKKAAVSRLTDAATPYRLQAHAVTTPTVTTLAPARYEAIGGVWVKVAT